MSYYNNNSFNNQDFNQGLNDQNQQNQQNQYYQQQQQFGQQQQQQQFGQQQQFDQNQQYQQQQMQQQQMQVPQQQAPSSATPSVTIGGFKTGAATESKAFVPKGKFALNQEDFGGGLDDLMDAPVQKKSKGGKKGKGKGGKVMVKVEKAVEEEVIDETTAWKGKPSSFFIMKEPETTPATSDSNNPQGLELNDAQWDFIFKFYPEYGAAPHSMITWLFGQALNQEQLYAKPENSGEYVDGEEESKEYKEKGLNSKPNKQISKADQIKETERIRQAKIDKQKQLEAARIAKGGVTKTDSEIEENKLKKAFKDLPVNMAPDGLVEVDPIRQPCSMVFIGHVDAGKSTICGNLMYLNGIIDQRTIDKYKQEAVKSGRDSWWLAYVMDACDEEREKGKTVEVGRAQFDTPTKKYTIFDAPGHKNYVPNMIMGAALADVGGLVISARKGEFEAGFEAQGQTREHAQLAKSLGVQKLVVVVNKMDDCKWSKARFEEIQTKLTPFLNATGYADEDLIWVPIAGLTGANIVAPLEGKTCNWYKGPTFMEILDQVELEPRYPSGPLRIPVLDKMKDKDLIVHGKVENGTIRLGDKLAMMPYGSLAQVMHLLDGKNQPVKVAYPGENVQIKINIADEDSLVRGNVFCHRDSMMPVTQMFIAEIDVLQLLEYKPIISKGYTCMMHIHTFNDEIVIQEIDETVTKVPKGEDIVKKKPAFAASGQKMICKVAPKNPLCLEKFETMAQLGRFTLRDEGQTICVGKVLKYKPYQKGVVGATGFVAAKEVVHASQEEGVTNSSGAEELVYDMDTGELRPKAKALDGIAEDAEEAD